MMEEMVKKVLIMLLGGGLVVGLSLPALAVGEVELHKLTASDAADGDQFGISVAISGSTALVGAWRDDDAGSESGSAYPFDFSDLNNITEIKLTASDAAAGDSFGHSVAISGTTTLVGAPGNDDAGSVSGFADVGGLVGYNERGSTTDSFWDVNTSGQTTSAGGIGMPTELMQSAFIFTAAGWDFVGESANGTDDFWDICDGTNYPKLAWQIPIAGDFNCPDGVDWIDLGVLCEDWLLEELSADVGPDGGDGIVNFLDWAIFADGWQITNDIFDLADFADQWLKTGSNYLIADIAPPADGDGIVNMRDFAALANNWLQ